MNDNETLIRAAKLLNLASWYPSDYPYDRTQIVSRLCEMAATDQSDRIAELEDSVKRSLISGMDHQIRDIEYRAKIHELESGRETLCVRIGQLETERERLHRLLREWVDTTYAPEDDGGAELLRRTVEALKGNDDAIG